MNRWSGMLSSCTRRALSTALSMNDDDDDDDDNDDDDKSCSMSTQSL